MWWFASLFSNETRLHKAAINSLPQAGTCSVNCDLIQCLWWPHRPLVPAAVQIGIHVVNVFLSQPSHMGEHGWESEWGRRREQRERETHRERQFVCESYSLTGRGDDLQGTISGVTIHSVLSPPLAPFIECVCVCLCVTLCVCGCVNKALNSIGTLLRSPYLNDSPELITVRASTQWRLCMLEQH